MGRWISDPNKARAQQTIRSDGPGNCEGDRIGTDAKVSVFEARPGCVTSRAIAKIPETIGYGARGAIGEGHHQRPRAIGGAAREGSQRHLCACAGGSIGLVRAIAGEKREEVAEVAGIGRIEANQDIGRAVGWQSKAGSRQDTEGSGPQKN